jgi:hypothetical protein
MLLLLSGGVGSSIAPCYFFCIGRTEIVVTKSNGNRILPINANLVLQSNHASSRVNMHQGRIMSDQGISKNAEHCIENERERERGIPFFFF